jgi:hypothetical protein
MIKQQFNEEIKTKSSMKLNDMFLTLASNLPTTGNLSYASKNMQRLTNKIDAITNYIVNKSNTVKNYYYDFMIVAKEKDKLFSSYCKNNYYKQPFYFEKGYKKDIYRRLGNIVINAAFQINKLNYERLMLNAKYKKEKILSRTKLKHQLNECLWLSNKIEHEAIRAFDEFLYKLEKANFKNLLEQGKVNYEM